MAKFRPRLYELIAKAGESIPPDPGQAKGSAAFYSGPIGGGAASRNPLRKPGM